MMKWFKRLVQRMKLESQDDEAYLLGKNRKKKDEQIKTSTRQVDGDTEDNKKREVK